MVGIISDVLKKGENVFDATYLSDSEGSLVDFINDGPISECSWTPEKKVGDCFFNNLMVLYF